MEEYVVVEVPIEGENPSRDKMFRTPEGREYRVRIEGTLGGPSILILKGSRIINSGGIGFSPDQDPRTAVEQQISSLIRSAEQLEKSQEAAQKYILNEWGVDLSQTANHPLTGNVSTKVEYLDKE